MKVLIVVIVLILYHIYGIESRRRQQSSLNYDEAETSDLSIVPATSSSSVLKESFHIYKKNDRSFYMSGDDGILHLVDSEEPIDKSAIENYFENPNLYMLYTRKNNFIPQYLIDGDSQSITHSNFDAAKVTVFLVHGWQGHGKNHMNQVLIKAFLNNSDVNVIVLDWSKLAMHTSYPTVKAGAAAVGRTLGQFIIWMVENGFTLFQKIHLVGFSVGAHVVGNAGRETGSAIGRITGLDPAGPLWYGDVERLVQSDAQYVEVIHTNTHFWDTFDGIGLGYSEPCGDADFYPNGGRVMSGCWLNICSHNRAYEYLASSLLHNHFLAYACLDYNEVVQDKCTGPASFMGNNDLFKPMRGLFRVNTKINYPY